MKNATRTALTCLLIIICDSSNAPLIVPVASAQVDTIVTVGALIAAARSLSDELAKLSGQLSGNALTAINVASSELKRRIDDLEKVMRDNLNTPINNLAQDIQESAIQLSSVVTRLGVVLTDQQQCALQNGERLVSGLQNAAAELKQGVPLVKKGKPRLYSYGFDGQPNGVVPKDGGRLTIYGYRIWENAKQPPTVELMTSDRKAVVRAFVPERAQDSNSVSIVTDGAALRDYYGQCLQLRVVMGPKKRDLSEFFLPFCVPQAYATRFFVEAHFEYSCPKRPLPRLNLPEKQFVYFNNDKVNTITIDDAKVWDLPDNCSIIDKTDRKHHERHSSNITLTISDRRTIKASGWLGDAEDFNPPIGPRILISSTIWDHFVTPIAECSEKEAKHEIGRKTDVPMIVPTTTLNIDLPNACDAGEGTMWYSLSVTADGSEPRRLYESPRVSVNQNGTTTQLVPVVNNYSIQATYAPRAGQNRAQASVVVFSPQSCRAR